MAGLIADYRVGFSQSSPMSWTAIPKLRSVDPPKEEADAVDVTCFGDEYATSIPGLRKLSAMQFRTLAAPGDAWVSTLHNAKKNQTEMWWRLEIAADDARTQWDRWEFQGRVASINVVGNEPGRALEYEVAVMPSSQLYLLGVGASALGS